MAGRVDKTNRSRSSDIRIDSGIKIKKIEPADKRTYLCSCCGREFPVQKGNFFVSSSVLFAGNDGYLTTCKNCVDRYYLQLVGYYSGNEEHALERCCQLFDWYYNPDISAIAHMTSSEKGKSVISAYISKMNMAQFKSKGTTYTDTIKEYATEKILDCRDIPQQTTGDVSTGESPIIPAKNISVETVKFFGYGYDSEEYEYLENQYGDWCTRYECKTKAQEELFKNLCIAQLSIQRAQKKGNQKEVNEAIRTFQDLLGTANIKPNQVNDNALADQNTFGTLIKKWENERPIGEPDEEWLDVDGIQEYIDTYFLGHLCNLVHVKNDKEEAYRKEMEKYTVKPPVYESDAIGGEASLLDKYSDKGELKNDNPE